MQIKILKNHPSGTIVSDFASMIEVILTKVVRAPKMKLCMWYVAYFLEILQINVMQYCYICSRKKDRNLTGAF